MQESFSNLPEVLLKLAVAVVLGGIIGLERETHDRPAGLRTHVLVCVGSAVYMMLSMSFAPEADPGRIAAQVATGIGFLGAGTIIRSGSSVRGLTTAASIWAIAAVGLCIGRGGSGYMIAISTTLFVFATLRGLSWVEDRFVAKRQYRQTTLRLHHARENLQNIHSLLEGHGIRVRSTEFGATASDGSQTVQLMIRIPPGVQIHALTAELTAIPDVVAVAWE